MGFPNLDRGKAAFTVCRIQADEIRRLKTDVHEPCRRIPRRQRIQLNKLTIIDLDKSLDDLAIFAEGERLHKAESLIEVARLCNISDTKRRMRNAAESD